MNTAMPEKEEIENTNNENADVHPRDTVEHWQRMSRRNETAAKNALKKVAELESATATEMEKAVAKARTEALAEGISKTTDLLVAAEARALAAELGFAKPSTAQKLIDTTEVVSSETGQIDIVLLRKSLEKLAQEEPYLLNNQKKPSVDRTQGQPLGKTSEKNKGLAEAARRGYIKT